MEGVKPTIRFLGSICIILVVASFNLISGAGGFTSLEAYPSRNRVMVFSSSAVQPAMSSINPGETVYMPISVANPYDAVAEAQIAILNVECFENGVVEPEMEYYLNHNIDPSVGKNDIDTVILCALWIDGDGDTSSCNTSAGDIWILEKPMSEIKGDPIRLGEIPPSSPIIIVMRYNMEGETGNWAQSDSITFNFTITVTATAPPPTSPTPAYIAGAFIITASLIGIITLWRRRRRMATFKQETN